MTVRWISCDARTGRIIEELPNLAPTGSFGQVLSSMSSCGFSLPIPLSFEEARWLPATVPGRSMFVAIDGATEDPVWAGIVNRRRGGTGEHLELGAENIETYLNRRYVGDHTWSQVDDISVIAAGLLGDADDEGINLVVDAPAGGVLRDRTYYDKDNKTVYRALSELSKVINGPEWTIDVAWEDADQLVVTKTARVRRRIGVASPNPDAVFQTTAAAVFDTKGTSSARYTLDEDYTDGKGANHVVAYSSGQGDSQPFSAPARAEDLIAAGMPRFEYRFQPSSSISDLSTLNSHAQARAAVMRMGGSAWVVEARWSQYPRLGKDWHIGDDIGWDLIGHRHPGGVQGTGRAIGWDADPERDSIRLILWQPGEEAEGV